VPAVKTGPQIMQVGECSNQQSRYDEQDDPQGHLGDHQAAPRPTMSAPGDPAIAGLDQGRSNIHAAGLQRRNDTEQQSSQQRGSGTNEQDATVQSDVGQDGASGLERTISKLVTGQQFQCLEAQAT